MALRNYNIPLTWLLAIYSCSHSQFGGKPNLSAEQEGLKAIRQRARFEAMLMGVYKDQVIDEAISDLFTWVSSSDVHKKFRPELGNPRTYFNRIIRSFVRKEIIRQWQRPAALLPDDIPANTTDPAKATEINDLNKECRRRLAPNAATVSPLSHEFSNEPLTPVQRCRLRQRQWKRVADLFPGRRLRPRKHQWK